MRSIRISVVHHGTSGWSKCGQGKVVAARSGEHLLEMVPRAKDIADIEVENFCNIGSYQLLPDIAFGLVMYQLG